MYIAPNLYVCTHKSNCFAADQIRFVNSFMTRTVSKRSFQYKVKTFFLKKKNYIFKVKR